MKSGVAARAPVARTARSASAAQAGIRAAVAMPVLDMPTTWAATIDERAHGAEQMMADVLFAVVLSGAVRIRIDQRYPLAQVAQAHRDLEARKTTGSSVLMP